MQPCDLLAVKASGNDTTSYFWVRVSATSREGLHLTGRSAELASHPALARQIVRSKLAGAPPELVEDAQTIVSELVTNAIVHGSGEASLLIEVHENRLHVEVLDADPTVEFEPLTIEPSSERGRGLAIVECSRLIVGGRAASRRQGRLVRPRSVASVPPRPSMSAPRQTI